MIHFQAIDTSLPARLGETTKQWIVESAALYEKKIGEIFFLFCSDEYLLQMNMQYLNHDTYTDIITFDTSDGRLPISGELYISIDRVRENAASFSVSFDEELRRVMIHGLLHLIGFTDKSTVQQNEMRLQENICLSLPGCFA